MKDFKYEAARFGDLDILIAARLEAEDALEYRAKHGRWPASISRRAWAVLEDFAASEERETSDLIKK